MGSSGSGRRPKPTVLKLLAGNPGNRALNPNEPKPERRIPPCPKILVGEARKVWRKETKRLARLGLMTEIDGKLMAGFCIIWGNLCEATDGLRKDGPLAVVNGAPAFSGWFKVQDRMLKQLKSYGVEFGLSPSSRSRIDTKAAALPDEDDELLG